MTLITPDSSGNFYTALFGRAGQLPKVSSQAVLNSNSFFFDGVNRGGGANTQRVEVPTQDSRLTPNASSGAYTMEGWIRPVQAIACENIIGSYNNSAAYGPTITCNTSNIYAQYKDAGGYDQYFSGPTYSLNTTYHVAFVFSTTGCAFYVNGTQYGSRTYSGSIFFTPASFVHFVIGASQDSGNVFSGYIDEVRVSNTARYSVTTGATITVPTSPFTSDGNTMALWHLDSTGGHATQARVFRSTQTSPNSGNLRDLVPAEGTNATYTTAAAFTGPTGPSTFLFIPNSLSGQSATVPGVGGAATGSGWRDTVADNAEQIYYPASTWAITTHYAKNGQTVATDITIRAIVIVYSINPGNGASTEIGRITYPDTTLTTAAAEQSISGSFSAGGLTLAGGTKIQVEGYVSTVTAGVVTPPAAAVNIVFTVDVAPVQAAPAEFTAIPDYMIQAPRSFTEAVQPTAATQRTMAAIRTGADAHASTQAALRVVANRRQSTEATAQVDTAPRTTNYPRLTSQATSTADVAQRGLGTVRSYTETPGATTDSTVRTLGKIIIATDAVSTMIDTGIKASTYGRNARHYFTPTDPTINVPTKSISGVIRNNDSTPFTAGATVLLVRDSDGYVAQTQTSAADGTYSFTRDAFDTETYHVEAYATVGGVPEQAISQRGLAPA